MSKKKIIGLILISPAVIFLSYLLVMAIIYDFIAVVGMFLCLGVAVGIALLIEVSVEKDLKNMDTNKKVSKTKRIKK